MNQAVLQALNLYKSYGRHKILKGVHFEVFPGTLVGIVGENGAGKSTLLRILAGDLRPGRGSVIRSGVFLQVSTRDVTYLTLGFNAITMIVGFILFTSTRKNTPFDHRLVLNGYPQSIVILAKLTGLLVVATVVSLYASVTLFAFWHPVSLPVVWLSFFCAALSYGGLGLLLGVLVRGELEGFFFIIMLSLIDTFVQNPLGNPVANQEIVKAFPAFAPTQIAVAGGFTHLMPWLYVLYTLAWLAGFALLGLAIFTWKTRAWSVHTLPMAPRAGPVQEAAPH